MILVFFHSEIRYRSPLMPFVIAGAAGGLAAVRTHRSRAARWGADRGRGRVRSLHPPVHRAAPWRALEARWRLRVGRGRARSRRRGRTAGGAGPRDGGGAALGAAVVHGRAMAGRRRPRRRGAGGLPARGAARRIQVDPAHRVASAPGRTPGAPRRRPAPPPRRTRPRSRAIPGCCWRRPGASCRPPRGTTIELARGDYGAVRDFLYPLDGRRWTRHRAELRLVPPPARSYEVTLEMASPPPAPRPDPTVDRARAGRGGGTRFTLIARDAPVSLRHPRAAAEA